MASWFLARVVRKCPCSFRISKFGATCKVNSNIFNDKKLHSLSRHAQVSPSVIGKLKINEQHSYAEINSTVSILACVKMNGLHTTSVAAISEGQSSVEESLEDISDAAAKPLSDNEVLSWNDNATEMPLDASSIDIFSSTVGDAPLTTLGLGHYTPVGLIQNMLDLLHMSAGLPWWAAIIGGTIAFRALVFPLMIRGQINTAKLAAVKPELERLQEQLKDFSNHQNPMMRIQAANDLQQFFKKNDCHPVKGMIVPLIQMPLFISFFIALRQMAQLPVESMRVGGFLWFPDLVNADPYYVLPLISAGLMLLTIETGAEAGVSNPQMKNMKNVFRGMCVVMVPLTYTFPSAIFLYWITSNLISLGQVIFLKSPGVKEYFGIPEATTSLQSTQKKGGFFEYFKAGYKASQEAAMVKHTEKITKKRYEQSLRTVNRETFDYNPRLKKNEEIFEQAKKGR